ncbi:hypothetical protein RT99_20215 [Flavobacterium sp. MEB061]|uniref:hypothetical protein n=1 Tax=Flavobacterium sp. MEB061 TaxID=1587524 RepID=UPI0005AD0AAF|nr:hypothetical protein [Flavobacterium sp. MEB061]KIQ16403.1 hypothetical protein RT99_20215 [Flavobacterium sp. MEB061]
MKIKLDKVQAYEIIKSGKMSIPGIADGKIIPLLIIDETKSQKLKQLIKIHQGAPPGDIETIWITPLSMFTPKTMHLQFNFSKHMDLSFCLIFEVKERYSLIDEIFQSQAIYLNTSNKNADSMESIKGGILVEIPATNSKQKWESLLLKTVKDIYKKEKIGKKELNKITKEHITTMRQMWKKNK